MEQNDDSRDRIDPVTGIRTGEASDAGSDETASDANQVVPVLNRIGTFLNTGYNLVLLIGLGLSVFLLPAAGSELAPNSSLVSEIIPTMIQAWVMLAILIVLAISMKRFGGLLYKAIEPIIVPGKGQKKDKEPFSPSEMASDWYKSFRSRWLAAPNNISMAMSSAWRGRERGLAIFAGVFLSSLVITTVLAYAVGLNQAFFAFSLEGDEFDAKVDFQSDPDGSWAGRTNDSAAWESLLSLIHI